jgi:predicted RNase H-like HicB family nuclease
MRQGIISVMERLTFPIIVEQDADGFYVSCPGLQGCYSEGETYEEAVKNIEDAIRLHLEDRRVSHEELPRQKSVSLSTVEIEVP